MQTRRQGVPDKQPEPQPPVGPLIQQPSLGLYAFLILLSIALIVLAFWIADDNQWPALLLNLSTGILGAVIILVLVDRRLRQSEIQAITGFIDRPGVRRGLSMVRHADVRASYTYCFILSRQLGEVLPNRYVDVLDPIDLLSRYTKGFALLGEGGSGKTTCVQVLAEILAADHLDSPSEAQVPAIISAHSLDKLNVGLVDSIHNEMNRYTDITQHFLPRSLYRALNILRFLPPYGMALQVAFASTWISKATLLRWLDTGKLVVIIDGIDELAEPHLLLEKISGLSGSYPKNAYIVTSRPRTEILSALSKAKLPIIQMPTLSREEAIEFMRANGMPDSVIKVVADSKQPQA